MKELRKKIIRVFRKFSMNPLHSPLKNQKDREIAGRFIDYVHSTSYDTSSLPYYVSNGLAKHVNKAECVFAMMCQIVLDYWCLAQCKVDDTDACKKAIDNGLKKLEAVYETYDQLKVLGDVKGYCLLKSLRKDLYEQKEEQPKGEKTGPEKTDEGISQPVDSPEAQVDMGDIMPDDGDMSLGEEQAMRGGGAS